MKIEIDPWQEFSFDQIFDIKKGFYNKKPEHSVSGNIPFLGATEKNNGITEYYSKLDIENSSKTGDDNNSLITEKIFPSKALCVTNNGSVGYAYFQEEEFTCSHDVNPLYLLKGEFNRYTALFIATIIHQDRYRWAYGRKWRPERMIKSKILLPAINDEPDLDYMEKYIKTLKHKSLTTSVISTILSTSPTFEEYEIKDLFDVQYGVNLELNSCEEASKDDTEAVNFVSRSRENNGVTAYIKRVPQVEPQESGLITVAGGGSSVLSTFVQNEPFYSGRDLYLLIPREEMSINTKLYITTIIMANKYKYSFGRQANKTLPQIKIMLPSANGTLDYSYIDDYVKNLPYSDRL